MASCLVIDDSESVREVAAELLSALGHNVVEAETAADGIAACADGVDLVLLDWDLPSLGALDFLRGAADLTARPTIILSATENDVRQFGLARAAGAGFHVLKPFDPETLAAALAAAGFGRRTAVA